MTFLEEINIRDFIQEEDHNDDRAYLLPAIAILSLILQQNCPLLLRMMTRTTKKTKKNGKMVTRDRRKRRPI